MGEVWKSGGSIVRERKQQVSEGGTEGSSGRGGAASTHLSFEVVVVVHVSVSSAMPELVGCSSAEVVPHSTEGCDRK